MPRREVESKKSAIVVGTDFSPASVKAVARAKAIAKRERASLHVVYASSNVPRALRRFFSDEAVVDRCERRAMAEVAASLRADGLTPKTYSIPGSASAALRKVAREVNAALVVVGSRGRALADAVLGSTAEQVVEKGGPPVLLVRDARARLYQDVTVAADVDSEIRRALDAAAFVARGVSPAVLHAFEGAFEGKLALQSTDRGELRGYIAYARREALDAMGSRMIAEGADPRSLKLVHGDRRLVIARAAKSGTLLVLDRGGSAVRRVFLGSVSRWVIEHTAVDVLIV